MKKWKIFQQLTKLPSAIRCISFWTTLYVCCCMMFQVCVTGTSRATYVVWADCVVFAGSVLSVTTLTCVMTATCPTNMTCRMRSSDTTLLFLSGKNHWIRQPYCFVFSQIMCIYIYCNSTCREGDMDPDLRQFWDTCVSGEFYRGEICISSMFRAEPHFVPLTPGFWTLLRKYMVLPRPLVQHI